MQELEKILEEIEIRAIKDLEEENDRCSTTYKGYCSDVKERKCNCRDAITVRAFKKLAKCINDGWIPVEKDLPKNESEVWVVLESTYGTGYRIYSNARYLYFENYGESHWCDNHYGYLEWDKYSDGHGGSSEYKVIAWQPIEPYRPERSDNHDGE